MNSINWPPLGVCVFVVLFFFFCFFFFFFFFFLFFFNINIHFSFFLLFFSLGFQESSSDEGAPGAAEFSVAAEPFTMEVSRFAGTFLI